MIAKLLRANLATPFVFLFIHLLLVSAQAKEISVPKSYSSIQDAIDAAEPYDTIVVDDGTYRENLLIPKPLDLTSINGYEKTFIISASKNLPAIKVEETFAVHVRGFTISGSDKAAISLVKTTGSVVADNLVIDSYNGIYLENSAENEILNNDLHSNVNGLSLYNSDKNSLHRNRVNSNSEKGIVLLSSSNNHLLKNTANSNYWNGITLWSSHDNIIVENQVIKNSYAIVLSNSNGNQLINNSTMRRLYFILPVALVYFAIIVYFIQKKLFILYFSRKSGRSMSPVETK